MRPQFSEKSIQTLNSAVKPAVHQIKNHDLPGHLSTGKKVLVALALLILLAAVALYQSSGLPLGMLFVYALIAAPILAKLLLWMAD